MEAVESILTGVFVKGFSELGSLVLVRLIGIGIEFVNGGRASYGIVVELLLLDVCVRIVLT